MYNKISIFLVAMTLVLTGCKGSKSSTHTYSGYYAESNPYVLTGCKGSKLSSSGGGSNSGYYAESNPEEGSSEGSNSSDSESNPEEGSSEGSNSSDSESNPEEDSRLYTSSFRPPLAALTWTKEPEIISSAQRIGDEQVLDYSIKNSGREDLYIKVNGYWGAVTRDEGVENNCTHALSVNGTCNIRLMVEPNYVGKISQVLRVEAETKAREKFLLMVGAEPLASTLETRMIDLEKQPYVLIKKTMVEGNENFDRITTPIVINKVSNEEIVGKNISEAFIGSDNGLISCNIDGDNNLSCKHGVSGYEGKNTNDIFVQNNTFYFSFADSYSIRVKGESAEKNYLNGIKGTYKIEYKLEEKLFIITGDGRFGFKNNSDAFKDLELTKDKVKYNKVYGEGSRVCVATDKGLFVSNDLGETWKKYTEKSFGSNHSEVLTVYCCNQEGLYAGTESGLYISTDNGSTWKAYLESQAVHGVVAKEKKIWAVTKDKLFFSEDGGSNWEAQDLELGSYALVFYSFAPSNDNYKIVNSVLQKQADDYSGIIGVSGVNSLSACKDIRSVCRDRARQCHPDKNYGNKIASMMALTMVNGVCDKVKKERGC